MKNLKFKFHNLIKNKRNHPKKWTLLIYANGNNDLAPEIFQNFKKIKNEFISNDINVIIQLAIAPHQLVKTLRSKVSFQSSKYEGTKRYIIHNEEVSLIDDLKNINMADPATLSDFIQWGIKNYPSDHIMVILSGHGAGFAGAMNDYTHNLPYIMSIKGMINAISMCQKNTSKKVDCLVLDTCYMNLVEVWHEFACTYNQPVKYIIGPLKNIPLEGLPCHLIIRYLQEKKDHELKVKDTLTNIVKKVNKNCSIFHNIIAVNLEKEPFIQLKKKIDKIADFIIENNINLIDLLADWYHYKPGYPLISLLGMADTLSSKFPKTYPKELNIRKTLESIVIYPPLSPLSKNQNLGPSLYLPEDLQQYVLLKHHYNPLLFAHDNKWLQILNGNKTRAKNNPYKNISIDTSLSSPIPMPIGSVICVILEQNPCFTEKQAWQIVKNLGWY